jgi:adenylate cyclase
LIHNRWTAALANTCFGEFTLDVEGGFLRRGREEVKLRPKSFDVLTYLVEHHGRLVTKDALMESI